MHSISPQGSPQGRRQGRRQSKTLVSRVLAGACASASASVLASARAWMTLGVFGLAGLLACGGDVTNPTASGLNPADAYWALQLNEHAVRLARTAPYDTIRLVATPLNAEGDPLGVPGTIQYSANDSTVTVTASGLVTARYTTASGKSAIVVASLRDTVQHVTLADTCLIQVTATVPAAPLKTFTIQLPANRSPQMPADLFYLMKATATDSAGNPMTTFPYFFSSDPNIAHIDRSTGAVTGGHTGSVFLYATTWAYGVAKRDSIAFDVIARSKINVQTLPVIPTGSTQPVLTFWPQVVTISAGGKVNWLNPSLTDSMDVVFDDPTNVDSVAINLFLGIGTGEGNIAPWVQDTTGSNPISAAICTAFGYAPPNCGGLYGLNTGGMQRTRLFQVPGTYHYHSAKWGTTGTVVVE